MLENLRIIKVLPQCHLPQENKALLGNYFGTMMAGFITHQKKAGYFLRVGWHWGGGPLRFPLPYSESPRAPTSHKSGYNSTYRGEITPVKPMYFRSFIWAIYYKSLT